MTATLPETSTDTAHLWRPGIEAAIRGEGIRLAAQPIVDIARGVTAGFEILSRFEGPPRATPDVWFHEATKLGLGAALEAATIRRALKLRESVPAGCFISINLDPSFLDDGRVRGAFKDGGDLSGVVVELTEHSVIDDYGSVLVHLQNLRDANAKIAIDDAGSGYAGLQWLMELSPDLVKLDRALVDRIDDDEVKIALVTMLGNFADRIDAWLLAEGLERRAELDTAVRLGIPLGQGYLLGRPSVDLWPTVVGDEAHHMQRNGPVRPAVDAISRLVETATVRPASLGAVPSRDIVVVVDEAHQPVCLDLPTRPGAPVLCVRTSESCTTALARAMTRPPDARWTPLVCIDETRRVVGIVRLERIVESLMDHMATHDLDAGSVTE